MNKQHFTIIVPAYNCSEWASRNITSIITQNYDEKDYDIVYINDCSTDNTAELVEKKLELFTGDCSLVNNKTNLKALRNLYDQIHAAKEGTVIVTVDGDDWLSDINVLNYLNEIYTKQDAWITAGSYISLSDYRVNSPIVDNEYFDSNIRLKPWTISHLRTFKKSLFERIKKEDLLDTDGEFYKATFDRAMMYPMVEMSGPEHFHAIRKILYIYNDANPLNVHKVLRRDQLRIEAQICGKTPYERLTSL